MPSIQKQLTIRTVLILKDWKNGQRCLLPIFLAEESYFFGNKERVCKMFVILGAGHVCYKHIVPTGLERGGTRCTEYGNDGGRCE